MHTIFPSPPSPTGPTALGLLGSQAFLSSQLDPALCYVGTCCPLHSQVLSLPGSAHAGARLGGQATFP